jgi:hypothetical protein
MKTIRMEIELTYDDDLTHSGEKDQECKKLFYECLLFPQDRLILFSNDIGDEMGDVKVLSVTEKATAFRTGHSSRRRGKQ